MNLKNRKNIIIGALIFVILIMGVAFAAFSTNLTINGLSAITSNWCVGFDSRNTTSYVATAGLSGAATPTGQMSYSGNTCQTNYKTTAALTSNFTQPGDRIVYTLTIANKSSMTAKIDSITLDNQSITSNTTITKGNIKYTVTMPASTTLATDATTTMTVTAEFQNDTNIGNYTTSETASIGVVINSSEGSSGGGGSSFTGTIYRNNGARLSIGDSISSVEVWCWNEHYGNEITYSGCDVGDYFDTQGECESEIDGWDDGDYTYTCDLGVSLGAGNYETTASNLNMTYYLKHTVVNDIVTASYVCFVTDTEHCLQGGDSTYYSANRTLLEGLEAWYNNQPGGSCSFSSNLSGCAIGLVGAGAYSDGYVYAQVSRSDVCSVSSSGESEC